MATTDIRHKSGPTSKTMYAILLNAAGNYFATASNTFTSYSSDGNHDIPLAEDARAKGLYKVAVTNTNFGSAGILPYQIRQQAGGSPVWSDDTDPVVGEGEIYWDGAQEAHAGLIVDAVWDELLADHKTDATFGAGVIASGANHVIDDMSFDSDGNPTAFTIYWYDTKANSGTHDKSTGLLFKTSLSNIAYSSGIPSAAAKIDQD